MSDARDMIRKNVATRMLAEYDRKAADLNAVADQLRELGVNMSDVQPEDWPVLPGMVTVLLKVQPHDGNDPIEQDVRLPFVPRKGDSLEFWDKGPEDTPHHGHEPIFATVELVNQSIYWPESIECWLEFDGFDLEQVQRVMRNAQRDDQP